jgi:hypothetical protein
MPASPENFQQTSSFWICNSYKTSFSARFAFDFKSFLRGRFYHKIMQTSSKIPTNHKKENVGNIEQGEAQHRKYEA